MTEIRRMQPHEAVEVRKIAAKAFDGIERFLIAKPKEALVAEIDGKIVGGIIIKYISSNSDKIGYYDGAFIHPDYHAKGIGSALYKATAEYLWEQGCTAQAAFVKDDNVASWKLFLNNGFSRVSFFEGPKKLGFSTMLKYYFSTPFFVSIGMEFYLAVKGKSLESKPKITAKNILLYLLVNTLLVLLGSIGSSRDYPLYLAAFLTILASGVFFSYIGTLFSKRDWYFRLNSGGAFLCCVLNFFGSLLPMIGAWYPAKYEKTDKFKQDLAMPALMEWISLLCLTFMACFYADAHIYLNYLRIVGVMLLFYKIIPLYPFESFGGGRVYRWNKWIYGIMALSSVLLMLFANNVMK